MANIQSLSISRPGPMRSGLVLGRGNFFFSLGNSKQGSTEGIYIHVPTPVL